MSKKKVDYKFDVGDRVAERPTRTFRLTSNAVLNGAKTKSGTIVDKELRQQRYRKSPKGYSMRPYVKVMWDIRSVAEWVIESRVIPESDLQEQIDMLYHEVG
tara:strand:- start:238 stop:543 length:306 start_codon:yes stop_codon:yes gene_type:complete